jgi:hypothetical protein
MKRSSPCFRNAVQERIEDAIRVKERRRESRLFFHPSSETHQIERIEP